MNVLNSKCLNRRTLLLAAAGAAPLLALGVTGANAAGLPQSAVGYRASPNEDKHCSGCNLFVAPGSCKSVTGTVSPNGWCKLWVKKA
ncbi:MAG: high potential iron sulfur protein [Roseiarcus sp.]